MKAYGWLTIGALLRAPAFAGPPVEVVADWLAQDGVEAATEEYIGACERRREARLGMPREVLRRVVFTKHYDLGGSHYAYTEGQSDAQNERHFVPGAALCLLEVDGGYGIVSTLLEDGGGVVRDPDVSYDGERVLLAWKKSLNEDDYHLYEMTAADGEVRQLTEGLGFADYEGAYLPNGDIVFNSTRCVQTVDCWWTEVSNLYTCDGDGKYLRRLSYDQVHSNYPMVTDDGRVIYTRWDYSDRGQIFPQGLFEMKPDGTGQTELYGNNSWFPTTIMHARDIPGTGKYVAVFSGHHSKQKGWLGIIDPRLGRQENSGAQLIAPTRTTEPVHIDAYGQEGDQFQYPYPLSETEFLVAMKPAGAERFAIYWVNAAGERELLAWDPAISCNQPVPLRPRPVPHVRPGLVDYAADTGTVYLHDIYDGPGLAGVERGRIRKLRVISIDYRAAGVGSNGNAGPAGGAMASTPVSIQGAWDPKRILGTTPVHKDGSACFTVPAHTPVYFQALDADGFAAQTMRSWVTLQPGEAVSCVGCHEDKNTTPPSRNTSTAMRGGPKELEPWPGEPGWFSFATEIQPILDRHCVSCHHLDSPRPEAAAYDPATMSTVLPWGNEGVWRYTLTQPEGNWQAPEFDDSAWLTGRGGFGWGAPGALTGTDWREKQIWLRRTLDLKANQMPRRPAFMVHHDEDLEVYLNGVVALRVTGYLQAYQLRILASPASEALRPGRNVMAAHCTQTLGGQYVDVGIVETGSGVSDSEALAAFSLQGKGTFDPQSLRKWTDSYKALADRRFCNWVNIQSEPSMLPAYHAGAAKSPLIDMLKDGHNGVELTTDELHRIATWIDLLVPAYGDYRADLEGEHLAKYEHFLSKRKRWEAQEALNIEALLREREGTGGD